MLNQLNKLLSQLAKVTALIGATGIIALMLVTIVAVFWRYVVNDPIFGISDISVLILSVVAAASVYYGSRHNAHVSVNVIKYFAGRKVTRITDIVMRALALGILVMASYALFVKACGFDEACVTDNLSLEHRPFFYVLSVSMLLIALHILWQLLVGIKHLNNEDPNEPTD